MKELRGKVAAVTGAASGIGRALAYRLAQEGCELALSDIDVEGLEETKAVLSAATTEVATTVLDVADRERLYGWADRTVEHFGHVDLVINNAGVAASDTIEDISYEDFEWAFNIDFWGVVYGTKAFLPYLRVRPEGHIVNISSINGMVPFPCNGPYNCAKYAVRALNETLFQELRGSSIRVTSVHPGGVKANIARNMRFRKSVNDSMTHEDTVRQSDRTFLSTPDQAASRIVRAIQKNRRRVLVGSDARFMDLVARLAPLLTTDLTGIIYRLTARPMK
jgi:NADP-dependent 3-hydroxy acid dehydrogenase YdfG